MDGSRIVFVLGKGGVGRSTVATALGLSLARRGERVLVLEWTVAESIAPWFGLPEAGFHPREIAPRLSVATYDLEEALRAYFVDHLRAAFFFNHVVNGPALRRLIEAAPGVAELLFLGQLWWLTTLAEEEAGLAFDRIVVDAPATGHGASLLDLSATLSRMGASGLLGKEVVRLVTMMGDPSWTGTLVVAQPDELATEETLELVPRVTASLHRAPIAALVNRSVAGLVATEGPWFDALASRLTSPAQAGLLALADELHARIAYETELRSGLLGATARGTFSLPEMLAKTGQTDPREIAVALSASLDPVLGGGA